MDRGGGTGVPPVVFARKTGGTPVPPDRTAAPPAPNPLQDRIYEHHVPWYGGRQRMWQVFVVGAGGCLGTIAAFGLGGLVERYSPGWRFPAGTVVVNGVGCLAAGVLIGLIETRGWFTADARLFLFSGFLSGFTTFSAFGLEVVQLLRRGEVLFAAANIGASVVVGVLAVWLGAVAISYGTGVPLGGRTAGSGATVERGAEAPRGDSSPER